jgi:5-methylcytosine-specific restriction endonuclease McrA
VPKGDSWASRQRYYCSIVESQGEMEAGTISKKKESKRMVSGVHQRGLFAQTSETSERMEEEVQNCGDDTAMEKDCGESTNSDFEFYSQHLGKGVRESDAGCDSEGQKGDVFQLVEEVPEYCGKFEAATCRATARELMGLIQLQQFRCAISGVGLDPNSARLDHIVAISNGGTNLIDNLQWVTDDVNKAKGTMSQEQFISMCRSVADWSRRDTTP